MENKLISAGKRDYLISMSRKMEERHLRCCGAVYCVTSTQYIHGVMCDVSPIDIVNVIDFKEDHDVE